MTTVKCPTKILCAFLIIFLEAGCQNFRIPDLFYQPSGIGVYHRVRSGQTLYSIAEVYEVDMKVLQRVNSILNADSIKENQRLWIPNARRVRRGPIRAKVVAKNKAQPILRKAIRGYLKWPVKGVLTSKFGRRLGRNHDGIDIAAESGMPGDVYISTFIKLAQTIKFEIGSKQLTYT